MTIEYVTFEDLKRYLAAGYQGTTIENMIEGLLGESHPEPEYTVYWPKDSIRVVEGSSYAVARAVQAVLEDPQPIYMGEATSTKPATISLIRRDLHAQWWASNDQVKTATVYQKDKLLPWDIRVNTDDYRIEMATPGVTYRLDLSTLPD